MNKRAVDFRTPRQKLNSSTIRPCFQPVQELQSRKKAHARKLSLPSQRKPGIALPFIRQNRMKAMNAYNSFKFFGCFLIDFGLVDPVDFLTGTDSWLGRIGCFLTDADDC